MGIDYGLGKTNVDVKNGIRFGVIHQNEVSQAWFEESEADYGKPSDYFECPDCGHGLNIDDTYDWGDDYVCTECGQEIELELPDCCEPNGFYLDGETKATSDSQGDIFILSSPYYTTADYCPPCAPGAGYLTSRVPMIDGENQNDCIAYCFGHDWFESGKAPYTVYSVETGEIVNP